MVSTSVDGLKAQQGWSVFSDKLYSFSDHVLFWGLTTLRGKNDQFLVFPSVCLSDRAWLSFCGVVAG